MKFLLEFKNYNDISIIQNTVEDSFFSEVDESLSPKVKESFLLLSGQDIVRANFKKSEASQNSLEFPCYLVTFTGKLDKEQFENISSRIESILKYEIDDDIICITLQKLSQISEFIICHSKDYKVLDDILEFEYQIEDSPFNIENDEYSSDIELTVDKYEEDTELTLWILKFQKKLGITLLLSRINLSKDGEFVNYKITPKWSFNSGRSLQLRWVQDVNLDNLSGGSTDINVEKWIEKNLPGITKEILSEYISQINKMNLQFNLDLAEQPEIESDRLIQMIRDQVFPLFSSETSQNLSNLYEQFKKIQSYVTDATWTNEGNYLFLIDINYKNKLFIFRVKLDLKTFKVKIELVDKKIVEIVPIIEVSDTIFMILQEN
jgi:hypothetical protein